MKLDGSLNLTDGTFKPDGMDKVNIIEVQKYNKTVTRECGIGGWVEDKERVIIEQTYYIVEINCKKGRVSSSGDLCGKNRMRFKEFKNQ
jgi:predicted acyltransferase (DUF342 family)